MLSEIVQEIVEKLESVEGLSVEWLSGQLDEGVELAKRMPAALVSVSEIEHNQISLNYYNNLVTVQVSLVMASKKPNRSVVATENLSLVETVCKKIAELQNKVILISTVLVSQDSILSAYNITFKYFNMEWSV